jgi:hypothetical protein
VHRRLRLVIVVTVLFGSGLIELPVASSQDEQLKLLPSADITRPRFGAGNTVGEPTSTFSEPPTPTISEDPQGRSSAIKWEPDAPSKAAVTPQRSALLPALCVSHGALQLLDAGSTLRAVGSRGAREANPLLRPVVAHPCAFIALKAGIGVGVIYGIHRLSKRHPLAAILIISAINGGCVYVAQRNPP